MLDEARMRDAEHAERVGGHARREAFDARPARGVGPRTEQVHVGECIDCVADVARRVDRRDHRFDEGKRRCGRALHRLPVRVHHAELHRLRRLDAKLEGVARYVRVLDDAHAGEVPGAREEERRRVLERCGIDAEPAVGVAHRRRARRLGREVDVPVVAERDDRRVRDRSPGAVDDPPPDRTVDRILDLHAAARPRSLGERVELFDRPSARGVRVRHRDAGSGRHGGGLRGAVTEGPARRDDARDPRGGDSECDRR